MVGAHPLGELREPGEGGPGGHIPRGDRHEAADHDARQGDGDRYDRLEERRYSRYAAEDGYDDRYDVDGRYDSDYRADGYRDPGYRGEGRFAELDADLTPAPDPEPLALPRRAAANRNLGLAPSPGGATAARLGGPAGAGAPSVPSPASAVSGPVGAAGLAMREPVAAAPEPAPAPAPAPQPYRITTLHPRTYNEARQIGESFRDGKPVIMNLTEMDDADAKRLVDFAAGLSFGLRGSIERVTNKVFLLSPQDVDVTAEDKAKIREGGFSAGSEA